MNAIIGLCHFCEAHGPAVIFCTQTLRETNVYELDVSLNSIKESCAACNSIGSKTGFLSKDTESSTSYLSTQTPVTTETISLVQQAAVRSLSCEVSSNKDGGFVFFGDAARGHVLSHTFQIFDSEARGCFKLFSIIILMKDRMFLLNTQPFLANKMTIISNDLQSYARKVYDAEQSMGSQRAQRLNQGYTSVQNIPRSLVQLTGVTDIFGHIHAHFSWILWAGARYLTESLALPPWLGHGAAEVDLKNEEEYVRNYSLRKCRELLRSEFLAACYCTIAGIQIVIRGSPRKAGFLVKNLRTLIPDSLHKLTRINSDDYSPPNECRILSLRADAAVPQATNSIFRVDLMEDCNAETVAMVKWHGELPNKWPNLLIKIMKAMDEDMFTDNVLDKHIKVLVEEWKNKIVCIKKVNASQDVAQIKKIMGILPQDQAVINYWHNNV